MILNDWLDEWIKIYKEPYLKPSSVERIRYALKHISEELRVKDIAELTAYDIDKFLSSLKLTRTRKYLYYIFSSALKKAYCIDLIEKDITLKIEPVRHKQKKGKALTLTEQTKFLKAVEKSKYRNLFYFYLYTGCRRSEALNVRWKDIDYLLKEIRISGTKTESSERTVFIIPELVDVLKRQQRLTGNCELVFPYDKSNVTHAFKKYCPDHHLHDLRHTFVTRCAESGVNINVAQRLAGHSDISTTLQIYTHVTTEFQKREFMKFKLK